MSVNPDCSVLVVEEEDDDVILVESSDEEDDQKEFQPVKPGGRKLDSTIELDSSSSEEDETPQVEEAIKEEDCCLYQTLVPSPFQTPNPNNRNSTLLTPHDNKCTPVMREVPNRVAVQDTTTSTPLPTNVHPLLSPSSDPFEVRDEFLDESLDDKDLPDSILTPGVTPIHRNMNIKYTANILRPTSKVNKELGEPAHSVFSSANRLPSSNEPAPPSSSSERRKETEKSVAIHDSGSVKKEDLPDTCCILPCSEGGQAYLVGTAHFSEASNEDVRKVIRVVCPGAVILELCNLRSSTLKFTEDELMQMASNPPSLRKMIENAIKGGTASLFHDFMLYLSKQITIQLGMAPGGEFRAAYQEANKINARVLLGDRSIRTTMKRAVNSSSLWTKFRLFYALLVGSGISDFTKEKVEEIKSCDLEDLMKQMEINFSGLNRVIVQERDIFLAYKIRQAIDVVRQDLIEADDSSSDKQNPSVVAVVGLGHSAGIKEHWEKVTKEDMQRIETIPEASKLEKTLSLAVKYGFYGLMFYGSCRLLKNPIKHLAVKVFQS